MADQERQQVEAARDAAKARLARTEKRFADAEMRSEFWARAWNRAADCAEGALWRAARQLEDLDESSANRRAELFEADCRRDSLDEDFLGGCY